MSTTPTEDSRDSGSAHGVQPLPKGAMATTIPNLTFQPPPSATRFSNPDHPPTPPATSSQRLLQEPSHVQFASYHETPEEKTRPLMEEDDLPRGWVPPPLRGWYAISLIIVLILLAIALELALHFTNKHNGWKTHGNTTNGVMHYVYTLPPVIVAAVLVALWAWTDIEIKKMQPYVDLVRGDAPAAKSLLLDYTRTNNFVVWTAAARNRHWVVTAASVMVLITLCFQPLASALLSVRNTWIPLDPITRHTVSTISLNQDAEFNDLTTFLTASGYASASVGYNLQQPPFVMKPFTVTPFEIPDDLAKNGTVLANTTVIQSDTNCVSVTPTMTNHSDGSGWTNSLSNNGCTLQWIVDHGASSLFGTSTPDCGNDTPPEFQPVVFWFFTYLPKPAASATFCTPNITLWDAAVKYDLGSGNITDVHKLRPFDASTSLFGSLSGNVTGAPLNGRAYNGINFTLQNPNDKFVVARMNATQLTMPAAVFLAAEQSSAGLDGSFGADSFVPWSDDVYGTYLALIAKRVYFKTNAEPITLQVNTFEQRLWMGSTAVHLLAILFIVLALAAGVIHIFHRHERQDLNLLHQPGTIASAVSIGAATEMGQLLAQQRNTEEIHQALQDKRFRIDPYNMKILMDGEEGYQSVGSPMDRRRSVFASMQGKRSSRRFSRAPGSPALPTSPRTPQSTGGTAV
ncbi:hypothetical protein B0H19DRAFT_1177232 [Mycena capillaripes]|nr:hypothetical protein B0H19DRAFT_1177232 [Mycena capillaripes]